MVVKAGQNLVSGAFTAGDPQTGTPPSVPSVDMWNALLDQLEYLISQAGLTPNNVDQDQIYDAVFSIAEERPILASVPEDGNIHVQAGTYVVGAQIVSVSAQTLTPTDGSGISAGESRIDRIYVDQTGTAQIADGLPAATPVPAPMPAGVVGRTVGFLTVASGQTTFSQSDLNNARSEQIPASAIPSFDADAANGLSEPLIATHAIGSAMVQSFAPAASGSRWVRVAAVPAGGSGELIISGDYSTRKSQYVVHIGTGANSTELFATMLAGAESSLLAVSRVRVVRDNAYPVPAELQPLGVTSWRYIDVFVDNNQPFSLSARKDYCGNDIIVLQQSSGIYADNPTVDGSATVVELRLDGRRFAVAEYGSDDQSGSAPLFFVDGDGPRWSAQTVSDSISANIVTTGGATVLLASVSIPAAGTWLFTTSGQSRLYNSFANTYATDLNAHYRLQKNNVDIAGFRHRWKDTTDISDDNTVPLALVHVEMCSAGDTIDLEVDASGTLDGSGGADVGVNPTGQLLAVRIA